MKVTIFTGIAVLFSCIGSYVSVLNGWIFQEPFILVSGCAFLMTIAFSEEVEETDNDPESLKAKLKQAREKIIEMEKMASLGQVTAGIAHELKNPLNFVNNFSEVAIDLLKELSEEIKALRDDPDDLERRQNVEDLTGFLKQNLQKINHHGNRANNTIRTMLHHADAGKRNKRPVEINRLVEEYVRLAFHGVRGMDREFNCAIEIKLDEHAGSVMMVQQEIGRTLLNLITNAMQAMLHRKRSETDKYEAALVVSTHKDVDQVVIIIRDNGTGIPAAIRDKIFTPFFSTKSSDEGTGLGLFLSREMIEEGHGGTIEVTSEEGNFTEMKITIPVSG